ncbi:hypothetical protein GF412_03460 [Candidatus Micrarchaeota archaeon]|nr:hypothetical protein [Candidatus Micrarchaeota archaeon]MBD3418009.1 hypothetical protein [Candidatus Micrarchaeota archaeon]
MSKYHIFILLALLLFGCSSMEEYYSEEAGDINRTDPIDLEGGSCEPTDEDCICMVCENSGFELLNPFNRFYSIDLEGGSCRFESGCTEEKFLDYSSSPGLGAMLFGPEQVHYFMLGQGSNFAEFADANRYCNNSLRLAVRWLSSPEGYDYPIPQPDRAECFLEKDVLPVYLLYSGGTAISTTRAEDIAEQFEDSGPVIISAEFDFDPKNITQMDNAIDQAIAMDSKCPDCLIAIGPRLEYDFTEVEGEPYGYNHTYDAIDYIFSDPQAAQSIDLVAVGLNSHHAKNCIGTSLLWDGAAYSDYILENYGKPTLWAYVLFDEGGSNAAGFFSNPDYCTWTSKESVQAYGDLYRFIPEFINSGVIGLAPYSLYGVGSGPLECSSCGMMDVDGTTYPQHTQWFSLCQTYYTSRGLIPLVFSPSPCADCSFSNNYNMFQLFESYFGEPPTPEELEGKTIAPFPAFYRCTGQLMTEVPDEIDLPSYSAGEAQCEWYPELDIFAELRDSDPVLARAITWGETGFNAQDENGVCTNPPNCDMCEASNVDFGLNNFPQCVDDPEGICGYQCAPSGYRKHSMGLMQVHVYPEEIWLDHPPDSDIENEALWCSANSEAGFNPFNKAHNACVGTAILLKKLSKGKSIVSSNEGDLGITYLKNEYGEDSEEYLNMKYAHAIFFAAYYYNGYSAFQNGVDPDAGRSWIDDYADSTGITDDYCSVASATAHPCCNSDGTAKDNNPCCNQENFIDYYQYCKIPSLQNQQAAGYGLRLLGHYKALLECDKYDEAEHEQNLVDYLESQEDPLESTPEGTAEGLEEEETEE